VRVAVIGRPAAPALAAAVERIVEVLGRWDLLAGDPGDADVRLLVGADDPLLPAGGEPPAAMLPACGPGRPALWARARVQTAAAVCLLDASEVPDLRAELRGRPVLACGLPRPALGSGTAGLDDGGADASTLAVWEAEVGDVPETGPGVAWVRGRGAVPLAGAAEAWASGRAVVTLPGTPDHWLLRRGGALRARTSLEAVEATRLIRSAPPLCHALVRRGRAALAVLPSPEESAARALEALEVAR
jgi:hypothetical protein